MLISSFSETVTFIASFPGSPRTRTKNRFLLLFRNASDGKLGEAWERGCNIHTWSKIPSIRNFFQQENIPNLHFDLCLFVVCCLCLFVLFAFVYFCLFVCVCVCVCVCCDNFWSSKAYRCGMSYALVTLGTISVYALLTLGVTQWRCVCVCMCACVRVCVCVCVCVCMHACTCAHT